MVADGIVNLSSLLRAISDVDAANAFAPAFMSDYNRRFAKAPRSAHDAHRRLPAAKDLT